MNLRFPLPEKVLNPNRFSNVYAVSKAKKKARERARRVGFKALAELESIPIITGYTLRPHFPSKARRDQDNFIASCKSTLDGIADSFRQDDHTFRCLGVVPEIDTKDPHLIIELELEYLT